MRGLILSAPTSDPRGRLKRIRDKLGDAAFVGLVTFLSLIVAGASLVVGYSAYQNDLSVAESSKPQPTTVRPPGSEQAPSAAPSPLGDTSPSATGIPNESDAYGPKRLDLAANECGGSDTYADLSVPRVGGVKYDDADVYYHTCARTGLHFFYGTVAPAGDISPSLDSCRQQLQTAGKQVTVGRDSTFDIKEGRSWCYQSSDDRDNLEKHLKIHYIRVDKVTDNSVSVTVFGWFDR